MRDRRDPGDIILDRRRTSRMPLHFDVTCTFDRGGFSATANDLTLHGLFIESETLVSAGVAIELTLHLPDQREPAKVAATVTRCARRSDDTPGFAVDFEPLDEDTRARISSLCEGVAKGFATRSREPQV